MSLTSGAVARQEQKHADGGCTPLGLATVRRVRAREQAERGSEEGQDEMRKGQALTQEPAGAVGTRVSVSRKEG